MNWPTNPHKLLLLFSLAIFLFACENPKNIGLELQQPQGLVGVVFTDTVTLKTSTVFIDSLNTTNSAFLLVGQCNDPQMGQLKARSYFTFSPSLINPDIGNDAIFQSLELQLTYFYGFGDTTQTQTITVHKVTEPLLEDRIYYNFNTLAYDPTPIGSLTFRASDIIARRITIPLNEELRDELGAILLGGVVTQELINTVLGSLVLVGEDGNAILGFASIANNPIALSLRYDSSNGTNLQYLFPLRVPNLPRNGRFISTRFNYVECNRAGTPLVNLDEQYEVLPEDQTSNQVYLQSSLGIRTKIEFPYLAELQKQGAIAINRADLVLPLADPNESVFFKRPGGLELIRVNEQGRIQTLIVRQPLSEELGGGELIDTVFVRVQTEGNNPFGLNQNLIVPFDRISNTYNANITTFLSLTLNSLREGFTGFNQIPNNGLIVAPTLGFSTTDRVVFGGAQHPVRPMRLRLFYTVKREEE